MTVLERTIDSHRARLAATVVWIASALACAAHDSTLSVPPSRPTPGNAVYSAARKSAPGAEAQVNLLARAFLSPASEAHTGFAYYAYLLFTDTSPTTAPARRAASASYLGLLAHVHAAGDKPAPRRADMAVLYVPLADRAAADALLKERDGQALLAAYNYGRARRLVAGLRRAGKAIPDVAIIGSTHPLTADVAPGLVDIDVVDLTDPGTVSERMARFRDSLEAGELHLSEAGRPVVLKRLREFFAWAESSRDAPSLLTF